MTEEDATAEYLGAGAMRPAPWGRVTITDELTLPAIGIAQFAATVFSLGIPHTADAQWATAAGSLDAILPHATATSRAERMESALLDLGPMFGEDSLALVILRRNAVHVRIAAREPATAADIENWLRELFPGLAPSERRDIPVRFWSCGAHGASSVSRKIAVPALPEIASNYPPPVRERLASLAGRSFRLAEGGRLILWYGPPGTGKTFALRALAWEWRAWCELHYVLDPEVLFGQRADYLVDLLLEDGSSMAWDDLDDEDTTANWRLLVLEDTGELLAADAKQQTGQGLSRLLNLVDGIVGQGLRVLVLVTTNEPLRRVHPAIARPGRCAARIEFEPFSADEAAAWLAARGLRAAAAAPATLAELFALLEGYEVTRDPQVGFAG